MERCNEERGTKPWSPCQSLMFEGHERLSYRETFLPFYRKKSNILLDVFGSFGATKKTNIESTGRVKFDSPLIKQ